MKYKSPNVALQDELLTWNSQLRTGQPSIFAIQVWRTAYCITCTTKLVNTTARHRHIQALRYSRTFHIERADYSSSQRRRVAFTVGRRHNNFTCYHPSIVSHRRHIDVIITAVRRWPTPLATSTTGTVYVFRLPYREPPLFLRMRPLSKLTEGFRHNTTDASEPHASGTAVHPSPCTELSALHPPTPSLPRRHGNPPFAVMAPPGHTSRRRWGI